MTLTPRARGILGGLAVLAVVVVYVVVALPRIFIASSEIGVLMLGTPDEHLIASGIHRMFTERTLDYGIPVYGGFYPNLAFLLLKAPLRATGPVTGERELIVALRGFSLVFGALTLVATAHLAWLLSRRLLAAVAAAGFLAFTPEFIYWSVRIHPDTLLLFLIALVHSSMLLAVRRRSLGWLAAAFVLSIFATMTKLVGLFFVPWLVGILVYLDEPWTDWRAGVRRLTWKLLKAGIWFVLIAYATTPTLLVNSRVFFGGIARQMRDNAAGRGSEYEWGWISVLVDSVMVGPVALVCMMIVVGAALPGVVRLVRRGPSAWSDDERDLALELLFAVGYLGYLFVTTRLYAVRYAMPALVTFALAFGLVVGGALPALRRPVVAISLSIVVLLSFAGLEARARVERVEADLRWLTSQEEDPRLEVGEWLRRTASIDSTIIHDYGVFVPSEFADAHVTFGLLERQVEAHTPDYVLLLDSRRRAFRCDHPAYEEICTTLMKLDAGELGALRRLRRFEAAGITVWTSSAASSR